MAINIAVQYPGKSNTADAAYPFGSARNITTPGDGTGTPLEQRWVNDMLGFQQALLSGAGQAPSGVPDTALASQQLDSARFLLGAVVATRAGMAAVKVLGPSQALFLSESGRSGMFVWAVGDFAARVAADPLQGYYVESASVPSTSGAWVRDSTFVTPQMYGGTTQSATQAAIGSPFDVRFAEGEFVVTGLTCAVSKRITLRPGAALKLANGANTTVVKITAANVILEGGVIDGNAANQTADCSGVESLNHDNTITGVTLRDCKQFGVRTKGSRQRVHACKVYNTGYVPILIDSSTGSDFADSVVTDCVVDQSMRSTSHNGSAITLSGAFSVNARGRVSGNTVLMPIGATVDNVIGVQCAGRADFAVVQGNTIRGGFMGISMNRSDFSTVTGNTIDSPKEYGVEIAGGKHKAVTGNTVNGGGMTSRAYAITEDTVAGEKSFISFVGNTARQCTNYGVSAVRGCTHVTIAGNTLKDFSGGSGYGLWLTDVDNLAITGNILSGGTRAMFLEDCNLVSVVGNGLDAWSAFGVQIRANLQAVDNYTVTGNTFKADVVSPLSAIVVGVGTLGGNIKAAANDGIPYNYDDLSGKVINGITSANPEGVVSAGVGSTLRNKNGGVATVLYVKEAGSTGNTGWVAK